MPAVNHVQPATDRCAITGGTPTDDIDALVRHRNASVANVLGAGPIVTTRYLTSNQLTNRLTNARRKSSAKIPNSFSKHIIHLVTFDIILDAAALQIYHIYTPVSGSATVTIVVLIVVVVTAMQPINDGAIPM